MTQIRAEICSVVDHYSQIDVAEDVERVIAGWADQATWDMENVSCEEANDNLQGPLLSPPQSWLHLL